MPDVAGLDAVSDSGSSSNDASSSDAFVVSEGSKADDFVVSKGSTTEKKLNIDMSPSQDVTDGGSDMLEIGGPLQDNVPISSAEDLHTGVTPTPPVPKGDAEDMYEKIKQVRESCPPSPPPPPDTLLSLSLSCWQ